MGKCFSNTNNDRKMLILPKLEEKYKKQIKKTKSLMGKNSKHLQKTGFSTNSFLDFKDFVGLNNNPLITEYRYYYI